MIKPLIEKGKSTLRKKFDHESKKLIKNSSWVFLANAVGIVLAFLRSIFIARGLGPEILGVYTVIIAFVITLQEIIKLNVPLGIVKYGAHFLSSERPDKLTSLIKSGIVASLISALVSVLIIAILSYFAYDHFFDVPGLEKFIILYSIINGVAFLDNIGKAILKIYYKFKVNAIVQMTMDIFEFSIIVSVIFFFKNNLEYFFYAVIFAKLINTLICNFAVFYELRSDLKFDFRIKLENIKEEYKEIRNYVVGNSFGNTLKTLMNTGDVLLLNIWATPAAVAFYSVSKKLAYSILAVTDPLVTSIYPQLAHLVSQKKFVELKNMLRRITTLALIPVSFFIIIVFIFKEHIITFLYGEEFKSAASTFFIHFIGAVQGSLFFWSLSLILGLGLTGLRLRSYFIAIVVYLVIACTLTPVYGANGVALGLLAANIITTAYFLYYSNKRINSEIKLMASHN